MSAIAPNRVTKVKAESLLYTFNFTKLMASTSETITGDPTVKEIDQNDADVSQSELNFGTPAATTAEVTVDEETIPTGQGVQVRISDGERKSSYTVRCTVATSLSNTRVLDGIIEVV